MAKFKVGDKVLVNAKGTTDSTWGKLVKGMVGTVERVSEHGFIQVRTEGKDLLSGGGIRLTFSEEELLPATELSKAIYQ